MIKTESAYLEVKKRLKEDLKFIDLEKKRFIELGLNEEEVEIAIEPQISFHEQMKEEVEYYERIKNGDFTPITDLNDLGRTLIAYRIFKNMSQRNLAEKLEVSEAQVSRDEKNEYYGSTKEKLSRVMQALGMHTYTIIVTPNSFKGDGDQEITATQEKVISLFKRSLSLVFIYF